MDDTPQTDEKEEGSSTTCEDSSQPEPHRYHTITVDEVSYPAIQSNKILKQELVEVVMSSELFKIDINVVDVDAFTSQFLNECSNKKYLRRHKNRKDVMKLANQNIIGRITELGDRYVYTGRTLYRALALLWEAYRRQITDELASIIDILERNDNRISYQSVELNHFIQHIKVEVQGSLDHQALGGSYSSIECFKSACYSAETVAHVGADFWRMEKKICSYLLKVYSIAIENKEKLAGEAPGTPTKPKPDVESPDPFKIFEDQKFNMKMNLSKYFKSNETEDRKDAKIRMAAHNQMKLDEQLSSNPFKDGGGFKKLEAQGSGSQCSREVDDMIQQLERLKAKSESEK